MRGSTIKDEWGELTSRLSIERHIHGQNLTWDVFKELLERDSRYKTSRYSEYAVEIVNQFTSVSYFVSLVYNEELRAYTLGTVYDLVRLPGTNKPYGLSLIDDGFEYLVLDRTVDPSMYGNRSGKEKR